MKNIIFCLLVLTSLCETRELAAQTKAAPNHITRCATMQQVEKRLQNPLLRSGANLRRPEMPLGPVLPSFRLTATVMIPVVVHIVLPNPFLVTDADVQAQINRLNLDFSGLNPDSTNVPAAFLALRGHSKIQFCLAKRTPDGKPTSGIERRASATGFNPYETRDPIKYADLGGLDQWNPSSYLNIWVGADGSGNDILGYAQFPASAPALEDGVVISYLSWDNNPCYTLPDYNKGRSATHEVGHYFGLLHIWGDDNDGCSGDDFRSLTDLGSACTLPPGLYNPPGKGNTPADIGDTPNQAGQTNTCPSGAVTDACSTAAPGKMYQNHMDYSLDACLTMFTQKQVERMEWVLQNCRSGLISSQGCLVPPTSITRDAAPLQAVNPGGFELSGCKTQTYPDVIVCAGAFVPKVRIVNNAAATLNTVTVGYRLDNGPAVLQTLTVNLSLGMATVVSFPPTDVPAGFHQLTFFTANPNGAAAQVPANDTLTTSFTVNGMVSAPLFEDFSGSTFPPPNWSVINPDGGITWERYPTGNVTPGSAFVNTYNYGSNHDKDELVTPRISYPTTGIDSVKLSFDVASATYTNIDDPANAGIPLDTLEILVSRDCGNSFTTVYKKWGKELRTVKAPQQDEFFPTANQWRRDTVDLTAFANESPIQIFFRVTNNFENNIFLDNVNLVTSVAPALLKEKGYLILPNPFHDRFSVWHYQRPTLLRFVRVYNAVGQLIWTRQYNGEAPNVITVDLLGKAPGVYIVRLEYQDASKNISERILKN